MKAAVLHQIGQPLRMDDVPVPGIGPDEALVATHTCGICRTDLHLQEGLAYVPQLPHVPGHEPAGVVTKVGERVSEVRVGQRVVPYLFFSCGSCSYCRTGRDAQCARLAGILGVTCAGGFAEYFKLPARNLLILPDAVPFDAGGLVSCAAITAVHAYRRARLGVGDTAVVIGVGGIGQILIQILTRGGLRVVAISRSSHSLEMAAGLGAELCLALGSADAGRQVMELTGGEGAACAFECVGTAATMKRASECLKRGGQIIVIGEEPEHPAIDTIQIAQRELEIIGTRNGSRQDCAETIDLLARRIIDPPIAARYPLHRLNEALDLVRSGRVHGRVVVNVREEL